MHMLHMQLSGEPCGQLGHIIYYPICRTFLLLFQTVIKSFIRLDFEQFLIITEVSN